MPAGHFGTHQNYKKGAMKYECNRICNWAAGGRQQRVLLPPIFISQEAACSTIPFNWVKHTNIDNSMDYLFLIQRPMKFSQFSVNAHVRAATATTTASA